MDGKSSKPKKVGNHYIPPPARKQGIDINEATKHKERPVKTCENRGVKLCNDSSLLFKESNDKVKEKSRRPRRSKRITQKLDAENSTRLGKNEAVDSKSSFNAPSIIDNIINYQSATRPDMSTVILESPVIKEDPPLSEEDQGCIPENIKQPQLIEISSTNFHKEVDDGMLPPKVLPNIDNVETPVLTEVENKFQSLTIVSNNDDAVIDHSSDIEDDHESELTRHHDITPLPENDSERTSNCDINNPHSGESQSTTVLYQHVEQFSSCDQKLSSAKEGSVNVSTEIFNSLKNNNEDSIVDCDVGTSAKKDEDSSDIAKIKSVAQRDHSADSNSSKENEAKNDSQLCSAVDSDWETIYDDNGDCLIPSAISSIEINPVEVKKNRVKVTTPDANNVEFEDDDRPRESSSIIEIYGFSEVLRTSDIMTAFGNWVQRGFNLKWVDNTHALGVFPTATLAEEALGSTIPLVKVRPISQGTTLSQEKARTLILPSSLRPKTCTALARRLVTGALGLRVQVTPEERAAERELLREAREKKKLISKQREAAWEGNFSTLEKITKPPEICQVAPVNTK